MPDKKKKKFNRRNGNKNGKPFEDGGKDYKATKCPGNDFAWYNKNPKLLTSASSLVFSKRYGDLYNSLTYTGNVGSLTDSGNRAVGGIVLASFYEFISAQGGDADPINIAAKNLYTWLRHKNSGAKVYEASDLIQVLVSTGSIKAAIEFAKKILRCVSSYSSINRYAMKGCIPLSDTEIAAINANIANYTARLNLIIAKATSLVIPKDIPLFARWKWLAANIFKDDDLSKATYYTFQPAGMWHYDWANHKCTFSSLYISTFAGILNAIEFEIDNLLQYEDYGTISGDILKAYGEGNIDVTTGMDLGEIQDPIYDKDAVAQFKNMVVVGANFNYELNQVSGNTQLIYTVSTDTNIQAAYPGKYLTSALSYDSAFDEGFTYLPKLVVSSDQPSVEECVEQTRLTYIIKTVTVNGNIYCMLPEVGTEIITECTVKWYPDWNFTTLHTSNNLQTVEFVSTADDLFSRSKDRDVMVGIIGAPQSVVIFDDGSQSYQASQYFAGENIAVLDENYLSTVHKACVLSEWTMPMFNLLEVK